MFGVSTSFMVAMVLLVNQTKSENIGGYEHDVVNLTTNSFAKEIANTPHFVMFYQTK